MSTVVQSRYLPTIRHSNHGVLADTTEPERATILCDEAAGIGFGLAVSRTNDRKGKLGSGGSRGFIGISLRDITMEGMPLGPRDLPTTNLEIYPLNWNMSVLTRGRMWVKVDNAVLAGDPVYFDALTGQLGNSASGRSANGYIEFTTNPVAGDTVTLNGTVVTFDTDVDIGSNLNETLVNLAAFLNASADTEVAKLTYVAWPDEAAYRLKMSGDIPGSALNAYTVATDVDGATVSGATLSGGYGGAAATGFIAFSGQPTNTKKVVINGKDVTFITGSTSGLSIHIGADLAATLDAAVVALNASVDAALTGATYSATGTPHNKLVVTYDTVGNAGNAFTLSAGDEPAASVSGATLAGGVPAAVLQSNAKWYTSALAGEDAILALSVQT